MNASVRFLMAGRRGMTAMIGSPAEAVVLISGPYCAQGGQSDGGQSRAVGDLDGDGRNRRGLLVGKL